MITIEADFVDADYTYPAFVAKLRRDIYQARLAPVVAAEPLAHVERIMRGQIVRRLMRGAGPAPSEIGAPSPMPGPAHLLPAGVTPMHATPHPHAATASPETLDEAARLLDTHPDKFYGRLLRQAAAAWRADLAALAAAQRDNTVIQSLLAEHTRPAKLITRGR